MPLNANASHVAFAAGCAVATLLGYAFWNKYEKERSVVGFEMTRSSVVEETF